MKKIFLSLFILIFIIFISFIWIISKTQNYTCPVILQPEISLLKNIEDFNTLETPISQLHLTTADLNSLLFFKFNKKSCLKLESKKILLFSTIGPFSIKTTLMEDSASPYLRITQIKVSDYILPNILVNKYNANLTNAWKDFFDPNYTGRQITQIEISSKKIVLTSEYLQNP